MPLIYLDCSKTPVADLSPLEGMPLTWLVFGNTAVSDASPLAGMALTQVFLTPKNITKGINVLRQMKSLKTIGLSFDDKDKYTPAEFWKKYDAGGFGKPTPK